ncbi:2694_t:CDS:2 [Acaulospora morrowiae]|uniref:2694_t:CDS:1 n=1 Tax=Acaulospora morrowiae TaxID=94023 RepID=A0A9N8WHD9_9GLOM|nr:2694_t:CDS:2 [Acaulospora morrowiae]
MSHTKEFLGHENCWKKCDVFWYRSFLSCAETLLSETTHKSLRDAVNSERSRYIKELEIIWEDIIKKQKKNREASEKENRIPRSAVSGKKEKKIEAELLLVVPPRIRYPKLRKSASTTKSTAARTPDPVRGWTSFLNEVRSYKSDNTARQYKRPRFHRYRGVDDISNEEDVRQALSVNILENLNRITTSRQPREKHKRISSEDLVTGDPDFIYKQDGKLLLAIEVGSYI